MTAAPPSPFAGQARWATVPSTIGGVSGALVAVLYATVTLDRPPGTNGAFIFSVVVGVCAAVLLGDVLQQRGLKALRALGSGKSKPSPDAVKRALREVHKIPDRAFWINIISWLLGASGIGLLYRSTAVVPWAVVGRLFFLGAVLAPITSVLTHVLIIGRSRTVFEKLAAHLPLAEVVAALPATRLQLRARLMTFTAISVMTPTLFVLDAVVFRTDRAMARLFAAATPELQVQALAQGQAEGLAAIVVAATLVILMVAGAGILVGAALGEPMRAITADARRIAAGDLRSARINAAEDEVWAVASAFTGMQAQLSDAISQLIVAGAAIGSTTGELVQTSTKHQGGAAEQASLLAETSATTEELARSAKHIAENAQSVAQLAEQTLQAAQGGMKSAEAFFGSMGRMRKGNQAIADSVVRLNKRVQQIGRIVEFINGIADKSDLLALNAELEGTKAGDVGRGFSLVAAEMRRLAESVITSTQEIGRLIEEIRDATNAAVMATEAGVKATDAGSALSQQVSEKLQTILAHANQTFDAVRSISLATHQQQSGTDQLATAMADVLSSTQASASATQQIVAANADLSTLSNDLKQVVARFSVS